METEIKGDSADIIQEDEIFLDSPEKPEEVPERPQMYKGQIWANADGSVARKIAQVRRNKRSAWRVVRLKLDNDAVVSTETVSMIDEFIFWALRNKAEPIMDRYR